MNADNANANANAGNGNNNNAAGAADAGEIALRCEKLVRHLGEGEARVHVLRGVSFSARRGTVTAIVGPSGCGKSTLLYLLGLLDRPESGEIWIGGRDVAQAGDDGRTAIRNEHIGFVFQFHFLLPEFSALENVMMPMNRLGRWPVAARLEWAHHLLEAVGLGTKTHRLATQLSGGEQQRVAIARALANRPSVILADEPTGNLDVKNSALVFDLLTRLAREHGQAITLVTHNPDIASRCDCIRSMRDGVFID
ncbi:MAG: ABC transporter ATP-binding protein [Opitutaceae bacterium]|jgi:lipoprotein-releasing system ATP-binding protein|nr:ABC transporter ATP-binding protein [Opitutaceae bacterium]